MLCTGTLVTLDDILTAAHCFADANIVRVTARIAGAEYNVVRGSFLAI